MVIGRVFWVGGQIFDDDSGGEVLAVIFVLFEAFSSLVVVVGFLFFPNGVSLSCPPLLSRSGVVYVVVCG